MKQKIFLVSCVFFSAVMVSQAQPGGGPPRQTVEQRVAAIHHRLDSAFKLAPAKLASLDTALIVLYKAQDAKMQELSSGGTPPDRETQMAERKKYTDSREEMIKAVLTEEQYTIWKEKILPGMQGGGRPGGNRQN